MATLHAGVPMISKEQSDIGLLRKDIERVDQRIDGVKDEITTLRGEVTTLRGEITTLRTEIKAEIKSVETRITSSLRWSAVFVVSVISAVIAFLTFWPFQ